MWLAVKNTSQSPLHTLRIRVTFYRQQPQTLLAATTTWFSGSFSDYGNLPPGYTTPATEVYSPSYALKTNGNVPPFPVEATIQWTTSDSSFQPFGDTWHTWGQVAIPATFPPGPFEGGAIASLPPPARMMLEFVPSNNGNYSIADTVLYDTGNRDLMGTGRFVGTVYEKPIANGSYQITWTVPNGSGYSLYSGPSTTFEWDITWNGQEFTTVNGNAAELMTPS
ncbi:MAG: hypothetical protein K6V97_03460 [Actinomycetia bacterium]|nr:hypothetical protein [Actinomycetes bacterium]